MSNAFIQALLMDDPDVGGGEVDPEFPGGCTGDPYYADVQLLLHGQGANNSTVFTDSSSYARTVSIGAGTPKISTTQSKFDGASIRGGSHPTQLNVTLSGITADEAWTLELWYYRTASTDYQAFLEVDETYVMLRTPNNSGNFELGFFKTWMRTYTTAVVPLNTWTHLACCVEKTSPTNWRVRLFVNGTLEITYNTSDSLALSTGSPTLRIGRSNSSGFAAFDGYIDEYRLTVGVARYSGDFPVPTLPSCNGPTSSTPTVPISGTEALTGLSMTVVDGDVNSPGGSVALTGKAMTTSTGNVALFSASKNVALVGQGMSMFNVARMTPAEYPFLRSGTVTTSVPYLGTPVVFVLRFNSDGSVTQQINGGAITPFFVDTWAYPADGRPNATTTMIPVTAVPNAFKQTFSINKVTAAYTATLAANASMAAGCTFTFTALASVASYYDYVAIVPTAINPKYGNFGYTAIFYLTFNT